MEGAFSKATLRACDFFVVAASSRRSGGEISCYFRRLEATATARPAKNHKLVALRLLKSRKHCWQASSGTQILTAMAQLGQASAKLPATVKIRHDGFNLSKNRRL